jgi:DNA polymerase (family X)
MSAPTHEQPDRRVPAVNFEVARHLDEVADLLEAQDANPFRVRAYRTGALTLRKLERAIDDLVKIEGQAGLERLPGIGASLARAVHQLVSTGRLPLLQQLRGQAPAEQLLASVPGLGPELASRVHEQLAAFDGRLRQVPGIGPKRVRGIQESLASRLRRRPIRSAVVAPLAPQAPPSVAELLDVDREYRRRAEAGELPRIAPRRFNPKREAWLPVLHTERGARHYTALFSNTARAHELGTVHDWVVIFRDDHNGEGQWTVVTARFGSLSGRRVVRGREAECLELVSRSTEGASQDG